MARVVRKLGETDLAITFATRAVALSPPDRKPKAQIVLANMVRAAGRGSEAITILRDAAKVPTAFAPQAWRALSAALYAMGDLPAARDAAENALALSPEKQDYQSWATSIGAALRVTKGT